MLNLCERLLTAEDWFSEEDNEVPSVTDLPPTYSIQHTLRMNYYRPIIYTIIPIINFSRMYKVLMLDSSYKFSLRKNSI